MNINITWTNVPEGREDYTIEMHTINELSDFIKTIGNPVVCTTHGDEMTLEIYNDYRE